MHHELTSEDQAFYKLYSLADEAMGGKSLEKKLAKMSAEDLRTIVLVAVKIINDINSRMESGELQEL